MKEIAGIPEGQLVKVNLKDPNDPGLRAFATLVWHLLKKAQEMEPPAREQGSGGEVKRVEREGSLNLSPNPSSLTPQKKVTDPQKCPQQTRTSSELEISPSSPPRRFYMDLVTGKIVVPANLVVMRVLKMEERKKGVGSENPGVAWPRSSNTSGCRQV